MRFSALLLALCFVSPSLSAGGFILDQSSKDDILMTLSELESNLLTLRENLNQSREISGKLDDDLQVLSLRLKNTEKLLREAVLNLESSESSLQAVKLSLTQASQALTALEKSFNDYRFWSDVKVYSLAVVAVVCAVGYFLK